jgi:outer membrane receptor for monomeric catechols
MVGYSFDHQFNDTFTVRQNLRFAKTSQNSFTVGVCTGKQRNMCTGSDKGHYLRVNTLSITKSCRTLPLILSCRANSRPARWTTSC